MRHLMGTYSRGLPICNALSSRRLRYGGLLLPRLLHSSQEGEASDCIKARFLPRAQSSNER